MRFGKYQDQTRCARSDWLPGLASYATPRDTTPLWLLSAGKRVSEWVHVFGANAQKEHQMKCAFRAILVTVAAISVTTTASSLAKNALLPKSLWHETRFGWCLEISEISKPFPGSDECVQISGSLSRTGPITGYACEGQSTIGFFAAIKASDNSIKPDLFVGSYNAEAVNVQYCARASNDWPPEYNCESRITFKPVSSCGP